MSSQNQQVMQFLSVTLEAGQPVWLVTLLSIWGSAPRPAGSLLAVSDNQHCGSLSGGCLEETLVAQLREGHFSPAHPHQLSVGITQDQARQFRLPCGGKMQLLLEPIAPGSRTHATYQQINEALQQRRPITRQVDIKSGAVEIHGATAPALRCDGDILIQTLGPQFRLLIVGANMVADYLASLADSLELEVWICDPRPGAFDAWPHSFTRNYTDYPDDLIRAHFQDSACLIVSLAHDPRVDDMALLEALAGPAVYIGAMGSRRSTEQRLQRLRELGLDDLALNRLRAPVGLDLGSKTPAEIAIAIAAELIAFRQQRSPNLAIINNTHRLHVTPH